MTTCQGTLTLVTPNSVPIQTGKISSNNCFVAKEIVFVNVWMGSSLYHKLGSHKGILILVKVEKGIVMNKLLYTFGWNRDGLQLTIKLTKININRM